MQEGGDWEGVRQPLDGPLLPHSGEIGADLCPALELCVSRSGLRGSRDVGCQTQRREARIPGKFRGFFPRSLELGSMNRNLQWRSRVLPTPGVGQSLRS